MKENDAAKLGRYSSERGSRDLGRTRANTVHATSETSGVPERLRERGSMDVIYEGRVGAGGGVSQLGRSGSQRSVASGMLVAMIDN